MKKFEIRGYWPPIYRGLTLQVIDQKEPTILIVCGSTLENLLKVYLIGRTKHFHITLSVSIIPKKKGARHCA